MPDPQGFGNPEGLFLLWIVLLQRNWNTYFQIGKDRRIFKYPQALLLWNSLMKVLTSFLLVFDATLIFSCS